MSGRSLVAVVTRVLEGMPEDHVRRVQRGTGANPTGNWDPERLAQAIGNLVGNALQHGDPDRPVTVRVGVQEGRAELAVHNHGPPIPSEVLPGLFEPFQRARARSTEASASACTSSVRSPWDTAGR